MRDEKRNDAPSNVILRPLIGRDFDETIWLIDHRPTILVTFREPIRQLNSLLPDSVFHTRMKNANFLNIYCNPKSNGETIRPAKHFKRIWSTWQSRVLICCIEVRLCFDLWLCFSGWVSWSFIKSILPFEAWLSSPIAACSEGNLTILNGAYFQESLTRFQSYMPSMCM